MITIDNLQMRADRLKERPPPPLEMVCWTSLELPWERIKSFQKFLPWETSQKFEKFLPWEMNQKLQRFFFARTHISAVLLSYHNHTPWFRFWPRLLGANLGGKVLSKTFKKAFQVDKKAFQVKKKKLFRWKKRFSGGKLTTVRRLHAVRGSPV